LPADRPAGVGLDRQFRFEQRSDLNPQARKVVPDGPPDREPQRLPDYLCHILLAIERTEQYTAEFDEAALLSAEMWRRMRWFGTSRSLGRLAWNIQREPPHGEQNPGLPLTFAYAMRNPLAHGYFTVDLGIGLIPEAPPPEPLHGTARAAPSASPRVHFYAEKLAQFMTDRANVKQRGFLCGIDQQVQIALFRVRAMHD
jgi:uncharacterized protein with HEPN domain